ncbi:MAG: hypothetical protein UT13_C0002G0006 [Candidatus Pacebacteria bacterium GW2011_GWF2_38_9]|nr:MAG: hypothetical protein UT13_C0002G0006 [Candidatus Pacebacteria bacterium GW2011_GWF2_38_9]
MPLINVSRIINSPNFSQSFTVYRKTGSWSEGKFVQDEQAFTLSGVVAVANPDDIAQMPEGDRILGMMSFHSVQELFQTRNEVNNAGTSDEIEWKGQRYRILQVFPYVDYGYYKALAVRKQGN